MIMTWLFIFMLVVLMVFSIVNLSLSRCPSCGKRNYMERLGKGYWICYRCGRVWR